MSHWIDAVVLVVGVVAGVWVARDRAADRRRTETELRRLGRIVGHGVAPSPLVRERLALRARGIRLAIALAAPLYALALVLSPGMGLSVLMLAALTLCFALASGIAYSFAVPGGSRPRTRVASLRPREEREYVGTVRRVAAAASPAALLLTGALSLLGSMHAEVPRAALLGVLLATVLGLVTSLLLHRTVRRVLGEPLPSSGREELAWGEVMRAYVVTEIVETRGGTAWLTLGVTAVWGLLEGWFVSADALGTAALVLGVLGLGVSAAAIVESMRDDEYGWFRAHAGKEALA